MSSSIPLGESSCTYSFLQTLKHVNYSTTAVRTVRIMEEFGSSFGYVRSYHTEHTYLHDLRCHGQCCYDATAACLSALHCRHCVSATADESHTADRHPRVGRKPLRDGWDDLRALRDLAQPRVREGRRDRAEVRGRGGNFGRLLNISTKSREGGKRGKAKPYYHVM